MMQHLTDSTICISFKGAFIRNASDTVPYYEAPFVNLLFNVIICILIQLFNTYLNYLIYK